MKISLIGYMGCGKTTIGKALAETLNLSFIDLDNYIETKEKKSIQEIFKQKGELYFRKLEKKYLAEFLSEKESFILSVGGGLPVFYDNLERLNQNTKTIYLRATPKTLAERLINEKENRPLIKHLNTQEDLTEFIAKHLFERQVYYNQAKTVVPVDGLSVGEIVSKILNHSKNGFFAQ